MRFVDKAKVRAVGGRGGDGFVGWRREKFVPFGGPDGGNGGNGGAVIFVAEPGLNTLIDFQFTPNLKADDGEPGTGNKCHGKNGVDVVAPVPVGTQVFYKGQLAADLNLPSARWVAARGGLGGRGNAEFASPTRQSPDFAEKGGIGDTLEFELELKSVADVGLVGLPNVGKSTLISRVSKATPKIADYPFTTLVPNLGVVVAEDGGKFVVADIPGLIPGAHLGKGLGLEFLKHVERTKVIAHLLDLSNETLTETDSSLQAAAVSQFESIDEELRLFSEAVANYPRIVVFTKGDIPTVQNAFEESFDYFEKRGYPTFLISSHTGAGLSELTTQLIEMIKGA